VSTTVFITPFFKNNPLERWAQRVLAAVVLALAGLIAFPAPAAELSQLKVERAEDGVYLSALVQFDLPPPVEDALIKGIPLFFVAEADFYQNRWYWADRRASNATRTMRLAFQPLTRRWRVNVYNGPSSNANSAAGLRSTLSQNHDTLVEALSAMQRLSRWKIAESAEIEPDISYKFEFRFNLDLAQLPRPFQIGVVGQKDWTVSVAIDERMQIGPFRPPATPDKPKTISP
jgi:Domain of unknown function (DUF4390)